MGCYLSSFKKNII